MKLSDLLLDEWIALPMVAADLEEAVGTLVDRLARTRTVDASSVAALVRDLSTGTAGELIRVNEDVVLALARTPAVEDLSITLGVAASPFGLPGDDPLATARVVFLLLTPHRLSTLLDQVVPALTRALRDPERTRRLLGAAVPGDVRSLDDLMDMELNERLLVEDALTPLRYRIYPDTPLEEVVDLMVRRGLPAVPVVGEKHEMLGVITANDVLKHLLPRRRSGEGEGEAETGRIAVTAREVMTRSVMCVSDDQSLLEAANLIVNKNVEQLPVVREGELVGFLTRDRLMKTLFGR